MSELKMIDVTEKYERMRAQLLLIRITLGLSPVHDVLTAVRTLHDDGKDAFQKLRGDRSEHAHSWAP